jgi:hypothetical protein
MQTRALEFCLSSASTVMHTNLIQISIMVSQPMNHIRVFSPVCGAMLEQLPSETHMMWDEFEVQDIGR